MKKLFILIIVLVAVGGATYFIINKKQQEEGYKDTVLERNQARVSQFEELSEGSLGDLMVGETVTVMGTTNQDGSVIAEMIYIGELKERDSDTFDGTKPEGFKRSKGFKLPEGFNPEEFQNLSREEMRERMQELQGNNNFSENGAAREQTGSSLVRGEIIDKDEISIVVKLTDNGSKLVFYSESTQIMKTP